MDLVIQRIDANITPDQINRNIEATEKQIQAHPEDTAQNEFDSLYIELEQRRLALTEAIMKEHPELNPNNRADRKVLAKLADAAIDKDHLSRELGERMDQLLKSHPNESMNWSFPTC